MTAPNGARVQPSADTGSSPLRVAAVLEVAEAEDAETGEGIRADPAHALHMSVD
jgi:hypothetical protein